MDLNLSKILTEAYLVVSGIFHSIIVVLLVFWVLSRYFLIKTPEMSKLVDSVYRSRTTTQAIRLSKLFRISALIPVLLLISLYSASRFIGGFLQYLSGLTNFFLSTSYDRSLQYFRFGSDSQIGAILKSACAKPCADDLSRLTSLSYGRFMEEFNRLENGVLASNPDLLERTYLSIFTPWEMTLVGYLACLKALFLLGVLTFSFPNLFERRFQMVGRPKREVVKTLMILLFAILVVRIEWERNVERSVMRDFRIVVASSSVDSLSISELDDIEAGEARIIDWRQEQLAFVRSGIWLRYTYSQARQTLCLPTSGLTSISRPFSEIQIHACRLRNSLRGLL